MTDPATPKDTLLAAIEPHVPFDGWSDAAFRAAITDSGLDPALAQALCPRGALDLAVAYHQAGDAAMVAALRRAGLGDMRIRDKITLAVRTRLECVTDKELVRRGTTLFALPQHSAEGSRLIWGTADQIWLTIGDLSDDINWYSKRATLSAVYGATVLYWLGDQSADHAATWAFLDRRIENVMQFEKLKADVNKNPLAKALLAGPNWLASQIKAPTRIPKIEALATGLDPRQQD